MSSTRKAKDDSVFQQARFASSPDFERGLIANLVARRCTVLNEKADRELIWFIQYLSHQPGGIAALANDLIKKYPAMLQTLSMVQAGIERAGMCNTDSVRKIRGELPGEYADRFLLKGETLDSHRGIIFAKAARNEWERSEDGLDPEELAAVNQQPESYTAVLFFDICRVHAERELEKYLLEMCLNPAVNLDSGPWYFAGLANALREHRKDYIKAKATGTFTTAFGQKISDVLDYTAYIRGLTLVEGDARFGKSHSALAWCDRHPGITRLVEVPTGNDDASFYRSLARGLGLGNFTNYKVVQIRERVESVLLTGDIVLVLDEAHQLWPQRNLREGFPGRVAWVMTMANAGVPICMIATPQFTRSQKAIEQKGWNSAQLIGRISHYEQLPSDLTSDDLIGVARVFLPEANPDSLRALAIYARTSARYLAAIKAISDRSRYIAIQSGRSITTTDDIVAAMQQSVIPTDAKLLRALENNGKSKRGRMAAMPVALALVQEPVTIPGRGNMTVTGSSAEHEFKAPLIEA